MIEYSIIIKIICTNNNHSDGIFLDEWINIIEKLDLQYGGIYHPEKKIHSGVIAFTDTDYDAIENKIKVLQEWICLNPTKSIIQSFGYLHHPVVVQSTSPEESPLVSNPISGENPEVESVDTNVSIERSAQKE